MLPREADGGEEQALPNSRESDSREKGEERGI
jgi:hypothetical protein